ncbi:MAG TPA: serine carboxypeptidase, partial [Anaerolineae bacterium]
MQQVLVIHLDEGETTEQVTFLGREVMIRRAGCGGDAARARALIAENDGRVSAIGLEGLPAALQLGGHLRPHPAGAALAAEAGATPVVDGAGIRAGLERWGVILADRAEPGIFSEKRVLMVPGLNHAGLAGALERRSSQIRYADPVVYFALPTVPGIGSRQTFEQAAGPTL